MENAGPVGSEDGLESVLRDGTGLLSVLEVPRAKDHLYGLVKISYEIGCPYKIHREFYHASMNAFSSPDFA